MNLYILKEHFHILDGFKFLHLVGFEPTTNGTEIHHSIQLSYKCKSYF